MAEKRQKWTAGAIVRIPLGEGGHAYGQMLDFPEYAFFDSLSKEDLAPEVAASRPVLCRLWVHVSAHSKGRWLKLGTAPILEELKKPVPRWNQDALRPQDIRLTYDGCEGPLVTAAECEGRERAAVWDANHVEDRLRDHFAGIPHVERPSPTGPTETWDK